MDLLKTIGAILVILFLIEGIKFVFAESAFIGVIGIIAVLGIAFLIIKKIGF